MPEAAKKKRKGSAFWLSFLAIVVSTFLSALDLTAVSTALPTITHDLHGADNFVWIGSAYGLASTAILPLSGCLADIFGRKPIMLISIIFFSLGGALSGAAQNMHMLIAARTVQGIGGGGILNLAEIITSDLVPLAERGVYQGMLGLTWSLASGIGPPLVCFLAWLFFVNLPLTGIAFGLVILFLHVRAPEGAVRAKLARVDWFGNLIVIAGTTLAIIGLTWGGIHYPWDSVHVLAPLIIGLFLICIFFIYERKIPSEPTIPWEVVNNRTSLGGYFGTAVHGIVSASLIFYLPVYFQASLGASPVQSAVDMLATALCISAFALMAGIVVSVTKKYRPVNGLAWVLIIIGFGLLSLLRADSSVGQWVGYQIVAAAGIGILVSAHIGCSEETDIEVAMQFSAAVFAILAPLPVSRTAGALAFFAFIRTFAQTWGLTISSAILQNELKKRLPIDFVAQFPQGLEIAYAAIPQIPSLPEPLRSEVQAAFATSMSAVWKTMIGISGLGFFSVFLLKEIPMNRETDERFGLHDTKRRAVDEKQADVEEQAKEGSEDIVETPRTEFYDASRCVLAAIVMVF
ncbi:putative transporter C3H1.06c [Grifola frondosa]|uniref:Putative transporter C3H1.06c n=1 Tax=Grifola frondosa TaxID=5627 RepID=A0A1C7M8W0_GRIFR|nr:putative transporter C3H1.06c [Grifola frondosa]